MVGRRQVLLGGAVVVTGLTLAACSSGEPAPDATADTDAALRRQVGEDEQRLIASYDATIAALADGDSADGPLHAMLRTVRDQHAEHLAAIAPDVEPVQVGGTTPTIADLQTLERAAAAQRRDACIAANDAELARVLTFIAASEAAHVPAIKAASTAAATGGTEAGA